MLPTFYTFLKSIFFCSLKSAKYDYVKSHPKGYKASIIFYMPVGVIIFLLFSYFYFQLALVFQNKLR